MNTKIMNKKLLATITIMLLFASAMLAVVPFTNAIEGAPAGVTMSPAGPYTVGQKVSVTGVADNPGATVVAYWQSLSGTRLNSTQLTGSDRSFKIDFVIPTGTPAGEYTIIVAEELASGQGSNAATAAVSFEVIPKLTLSVNGGTASGEVNAARRDTITIIGTGFNATTGARTITITSTLPTGEFVYTPATITTSTAGEFTASFVVDSNTIDGAYTITATNNGATPQSASAILNVGPVLTVSPNPAATGTLVMVSGRGFTPGGTVASLTFDGAAVTFTPATVTIDADGRFSLQTMVPYIAAPKNNVQVVATDSGPKTGSTTLNVNRVTTISASPRLGDPTQRVNGIVITQGDTITLTGTYFAQIANNKVTVTLSRTGFAPIVLDATDWRTDASGSFIGTFIVPETPTGQYTITATAGDYTATSIFAVVHASVDVTPRRDAIVTGMDILITGPGFDVISPFSNATISIDGQKISTAGLTQSDLTVTGFNYFVKNLSPGSHIVTITAYSNYGILERSTVITVIGGNSITVVPPATIRGGSVNITGTYFAQNSLVTLQIFNATTHAYVGSIPATTTDSVGRFSILYGIPINFALGDYIINATDSRGLTSEASLQVIKLEMSIILNSNTYKQQDIGSFSITSKAPAIGSIKIYDANNVLRFDLAFVEANWVLQADGNYVYQMSSGGGVPYGAMFQLPVDAALGTWTWNASFVDATDILKVDGTFTVTSRDGTTPPTATPTATPTDEPTPTPEPKTGSRTWIIIAIAVVALIIGVIAVFLFITMRRKIAN